MKNKVKYGLKKLAIAVMTVAEDGTLSYEKPVLVPGAKSISLAPNGELIEVEGDDQSDYFSTNSNYGYDGTIEVNNLPDEISVKILGEELDKNKVQFENSNAQPSRFALLFEIDGDARQTRFCFINVMASRPNVESKTRGKSLEVTPDSLPISVRPSPIDGRVKAKTTENTPKEIYDKWYDAVPVYVDPTVQA